MDHFHLDRLSIEKDLDIRVTRILISFVFQSWLPLARLYSLANTAIIEKIEV